MGRQCCIPGCAKTSANAHLFKVPAKRFCTGAKYEWAENLEKFIRSMRQDQWLDQLYKKDDLKICELHFASSDLLKGEEMILYRTLHHCIHKSYRLAG